MITIKEVAVCCLELLVFVAFIVIAYLFLAGLCVTVHDVASCSN